MGQHALKPGWTWVKFGDVVRQVKDKVDAKSSGLKWYVGGEHMDTDDLRIRRRGEITDDYLGPAFHMRFQPGHVLYGSRRTYLRKVAVADFEGICANTTFVLESKDPDTLLPELLPFIMQTEAFHEFSITNSKGSVNPYINFSDLAEYEFALPPLAEQRRIAELLSSAEENLHALYKARAMAFSLWRSLSRREFGMGKDSFSDPLDEHYTVVSGQVSPQDEAYADLPLIAPNHIESGTGEILEVQTAREQGAISGKYLFEAGAVLYSKIRPELMNVTIALTRGLCSADMYALVPEPSLRKEYLLEILLSDRFTQFAISGSMRTGMPKINRNHLVRYRCRVPTLFEQDRYIETASAIRHARTILSDHMETAKRAKESILRKVLY